jgi:hypothetical protein
MRGVNLANRNASGSVWQSPEGGVCHRFINNTAAASVKGAAVSVDPAADRAVILSPLTTTGCIGVFYESGIPAGEDAWVVMEGVADVAFNDNVAVPGNYARIPVVGDAAIAVAEEVEFTFTEAVNAVAGNILVKLPSIPAVSIAVAAGDNHDAVAAKVAAGVFAGWTQAAVNEVVTFTQTVPATTDGISSMTPALTLVTATIVVNHVGKPAITPAAGIAVADAALPADGVEIGIVLEAHTARMYADGVFTAKCALKSN